MDLMMEKSGVVGLLQQLGHLLQEERLLSEQLRDQASADRLMCCVMCIEGERE